jgi:hypothetical protein
MEASLADPARDVTFGSGIFRICENRARIVKLDQITKVEKSSFLANPGRLLHRMGNDNHRVVLL